MRKYTGRIKTKGFTLIEIIVVIAIIGILAAILVPSALGYIRKARKTSDRASAKEILNNVDYVLVENRRRTTQGKSWKTPKQISPYESFYYPNGSSYNAARKGNLHEYIKQEDDGTQYILIPVAYLEDRKGTNWHTFTEDEKKPFVDALNEQMADSSGNVYIPIKYQPEDSSYDLNRWYLVYRYDDPSVVEVWVGSTKYGTYGGPIYRVHPDPTY